MTPHDLQGLKVLFEKEKKLNQLMQKSGLTYGEKSDIINLMQLATLDPDQYAQLQTLITKTGLSKEEKDQ
mgnify:CR=1 FL=1